MTSNSSLRSRLASPLSVKTVWWSLGSIVIAISSLALLLQWCPTCHSRNWLEQVGLPIMGVGFGLTLLLAGFSKNQLLRKNIEAAVLVAGVLSPLPLGLMQLGYHPCWLCGVVWAGVIALFLQVTFSSKERLGQFALGAWALSLILAVAIRALPSTNIAAKGLLLSLGLRSSATNSGPEVGSTLPSRPLLTSTSTILVWTQCGCPINGLQTALKLLHQQGKSPIILALGLEPQMAEWAPKSPVVIINRDDLQSWNFSPDQPHFILEVQDRRIVANTAVTTLGKK